MPNQHVLDMIETIAQKTVAPNANRVDTTGEFPSESIEALRAAGLLGLISAKDVGGMGEGHRAAAAVVERLARECGSTAMVVCMHFCGVAVVEAHGSRAMREALASGAQLATLAFSEAGSRSQFWAPLSTAARENGHVALSAMKTWVTSAGHADVYVWSSKPMAGEGPSTIWLVPRTTSGLEIAQTFNGLGLRGNDSSPVKATRAIVPPSAMLGDDGAGFNVMMGVVLPYFQVLNAAVSVGLMEAAVARTAAHASATQFAHVQQSIADLPTARAYIARMRVKTDMARSLLNDTLSAMEDNRPDAMLRVLEVKAAAGEAATEVTDLAMRVCGGAAFRKEVGVERVFRDARAATVMAPTTDALYDFIGKAVCGLPLF